MPVPPSTNHGKRSQKYVPSTEMRVSAATEIADASSPSVNVVRTPMRPTTTCATFDITTTAIAKALKAAPVWTAE